MSDTRIHQIAALLSDAAALARELDDELDRHHPASNPMEWVLIRIAQAQQRIPDLKAAFMDRCAATDSFSQRCELETGHDGKHQRRRREWAADAPPERYGTVVGVHEWDEDSLRQLADRHGSRFD